MPTRYWTLGKVNALAINAFYVFGLGGAWQFFGSPIGLRWPRTADQLQLQPIVSPYWKSRPASAVGGSLS